MLPSTTNLNVSDSINQYYSKSKKYKGPYHITLSMAFCSFKSTEHCLQQNETARDIATRKDLNEILVILNSPNAARSKSKSGKAGHEKDRNEKKRGKNESGTSSKDSSSRQKDKKKVG
jgi:hypothetical protein